MATSSQFDDANLALEDQLREQYGRAAYSHKAHEKTADRLTKVQRWAVGFEIGLSALTTTSLLIVVFAESQAGAVFGAVCSTLLLGLTLWLQRANFGQRIERHIETASKLWGIRETYLTLLTDLNSPRPDLAYIKGHRQRLQDLLERIYATAPRTLPEAYPDAQKALKNNEELFFSEKELDLMLPEELRRSVRQQRSNRSGEGDHAV